MLLSGPRGVRHTHSSGRNSCQTRKINRMPSRWDAKMPRTFFRADGPPWSVERQLLMLTRSACKLPPLRA